MIEVEIKVPISDKNKIIQKLKNIGFIFKKSVIQKDIYFQHPSRNFVKTDEALRIRETPEEVFLNYKGPKIDTTTKTQW
ncbi:MAG: class IV adenylate cyclase [Candidatus Helarchaeota archaeon]